MRIEGNEVVIDIFDALNYIEEYWQPLSYLNNSKLPTEIPGSYILEKLAKEKTNG